MMAPDILVAGGQGKLGSALGRKGATALGRSELDVLSAESIAHVLGQYTPKLVVNCTAYTDVDKAEEEPAEVFRLNVDGARNLAEACRRRNTPLIHLSTDCVFGDENPDTPVNETAQPAPLSVYGHSKLEGERVVIEAAGQACVARVSWLFDESADSFIGKALNWAKGRVQMKFVDDAYGRPTPTDALSEWLLRLADLMQDTGAVPPILHMGSVGPVNRFEWAETIFDQSAALGGPSPSLSPCASDTFNDAARRPRGLVLDTALADSLLGPMPDWRTASDKVVSAIVSARACI